MNGTGDGIGIHRWYAQNFDGGASFLAYCGIDENSKKGTCAPDHLT